MGRISATTRLLGFVVGAVLASPIFFIGGCSSTSPENEPTEWYNKPVLRSIWGDYDKTAQLDIADPQARAKLRERGSYLVRNVSACGMCHGATAGDPNAPLSGGRLMRDRFGDVRAPNITPDPKTGIGKWNFLEVMRVLRASIDKDGRPVSLDVHADYRWLSDRDAKAIAIYLQSLPPVSNPVERRRLGAFERNRWLVIPRHTDVAGYIPALPEVESPHYGRYLSEHVSGCRNCHTPGGSASGAEAFSGGTFQRGHSFIGALTGLIGLFVPEKPEPAEVTPYLSEEGKAELGLEGKNPSTVATERRTEALDTGRFPIGGPDIRGKSGTILNEWSVEQIVDYISTGTTPKGETADGRLCPWPFYRTMNDREKRSIALYLKTL